MFWVVTKSFGYSSNLRWLCGSRTYFSVSKATRMLSRVSLGCPWWTEGGSVVPVPACSIAFLDDPGTADVSRPCEERMGSELSALPLTSAPMASREELKTKGEKIFICSCVFTNMLLTLTMYTLQYTTVGSLPASCGVSSALWDPRRGRSLCEHSGHGGGGVGLCDSDLLGLSGLLSTVGTEALTFQHWGTSTMETVRDADVWLALHEGPLRDEKQQYSWAKKRPDPHMREARTKECVDFFLDFCIFLHDMK